LRGGGPPPRGEAIARASSDGKGTPTAPPYARCVPVRAPVPSPHDYTPGRALAQALAQALVYRDRPTRYADAAEEFYGLPQARDSQLIIVLGRADALSDDRRRVLVELNNSLHRIEIVPYDVVSKRARAMLDNVERHLSVRADDLTQGQADPAT
jgi:hypothetical protein